MTVKELVDEPAAERDVCDASTVRAKDCACPRPAFETIGFVTSAGGLQNEDRAGHRGNIAWMIDGATDVLEERLLPAASDAEWYAEQLHSQLVRHGDDGVASLVQLLDEVTRELAGRFAAAAKRPPREVHEYPSAAGVIVRRTAEAIEVLSLGDCELITAAGAADATALGIDDRLRVRDRGTALAMRAVRDEGAQTWKEARKLLWPRFRTARANLNQPGGYPVFSIIPPPAGMVSIKDWRCRRARHCCSPATASCGSSRCSNATTAPR